MSDTQHASWSSRWTFILAATGSAVGLGNIWKFPYITGEYGGGAFVLVYLVCIALVGIPVMIGEAYLGKRGRLDPVNSLRKITTESGTDKRWTLIGISGVLAGVLIMMFYSVVAGWSLEYVWLALQNGYSPANAGLQTHFDGLTGSIERQLLWQTLFVIATMAILAAGVIDGIGRTTGVLMPVLFVLLLILLGYSLSNGAAAEAAGFMFAPDFSKLSAEAVLVALGHAFFTLSLGMGAIIAYGSYMPENANIGKTILTVAALDTLIALVAGMAIFPLVFANSLAPGAGPGLMFVTLPISFSAMPMGSVFGGLFFALVAIAALSSAISMIEPAVAWLENNGISRHRATLGLGMVIWLGGAASVYSSEIFNLLDMITAQYMLPLGGLLIALFVGWVLPGKPDSDWFFDDFDIHPTLLKCWYITLKFITPIGILLVFAHSLELL